jgi:acetolactate synthase regulatory subunit
LCIIAIIVLIFIVVKSQKSIDSLNTELEKYIEIGYEQMKSVNNRITSSLLPEILAKEYDSFEFEPFLSGKDSLV